MCTTPSDSSTGTDFRSLAEDVVLRFLLFCDVDTLFACKQVSRPLQCLIDTDIYLQYKIELTLNGMVDGPASCSMNIVEKLQLLRDYTTQYHDTKFTASGFKYSWQRYPQDETMPTTDWEALLGFRGSIVYIVIKLPQRQIGVCAPPPFYGPRKMRDWAIPYKALSGRRDLVVVSVSVDLSQDLLLVAVQAQGADTRHLSILLRSLDNPNEAHPCALEPTLAVTASDNLRSVRDNTPDPSMLHADSIQIHGSIVAWKLSVMSDPPIPCNIKVWDWRVGHRLWRSHFASDSSFTLLDDAHIVTAGPERGELVVKAFAQGTRGEETGPVLALALPPQRESVRIQESSIPSPRSPTEPFWTDPALRMVVIKLTDESALLIPFKTFLDQISATQARRQVSPRRIEPPRLTWEDWCTQTFPLVTAETEYPLWSFKHCHSYGSRIVVNGYKHLAIMFDLNSWAGRNTRCFPKPDQWSDEDKTPEDLFSTKDVALPHGAVLNKWYHGMELGQSTPGLATDPMGFTEVYSMMLNGRLHAVVHSVVNLPVGSPTELAFGTDFR
ncbi:hypothetical protein V8D89_008940 [Ganoderma adspersum]